MPHRWIAYDGKMNSGDVWRWKEPAWKPKARKKSKGVVIGEHSVIAQLLKVEGEWLEFRLLSCETKRAENWWKPVPGIKPEFRRKRETLVKRKPERRPWATADGEPARSVTVSKYLN